MLTPRGTCGRIAAWCALFALAACASGPTARPESTYSKPPGPRMVLDGLKIEPAIEARVLALDPEHVSDADVRQVLAKVPAPRLVLIEGGCIGCGLIIDSFAQFLTGMGFPEAAIRDPATGSTSYSCYADSVRLAGTIAYYFEREGVRPMVIGHSQGGMQTVKVLHELAGGFEPSLPVWNPFADAPEARTTIIDPLTGRERPVVGLVLPYASAVGAGGSSRLLPNHWSMATKLYVIPDSVEDFTGYFIGFDIFALDFAGRNNTLYRASGKATIRNVRLPADYAHLFVPHTSPLSADPAMRDYVNAWNPAWDSSNAPPLPAGDASNVFWGADVWYSIKKHWVLEAQRLVRARRGTAP